MNKFVLCTIITSSVLFFAFVLAVILSVSIVGSSLSDTWIKPGEQILICKNKEFTVKPDVEGVKALISATGTPSHETYRRTSNEAFDSTIQKSSMSDITKFHSGASDIIDIEIDASDEVILEVYYYKEITVTSSSASASQNPDVIDGSPIIPERRRKHKSSSSSKSKSTTKTKKVRFVPLAINGTGTISGSATLPGTYEYGIGISGTVGTSYGINITYSRYYYTTSRSVTCPSKTKTKLNSDKISGYCAVLEMEYNDVITEPMESRNDLDLFCEKRISTVDMAMMCLFGSLFLFSLFFVAIAFCVVKRAKEMGIEMNGGNGNNNGNGNGNGNNFNNKSYEFDNNGVI